MAAIPPHASPKPAGGGATLAFTLVGVLVGGAGGFALMVEGVGWHPPAPGPGAIFVVPVLWLGQALVYAVIGSLAGGSVGAVIGVAIRSRK